MYFDTVLVLNFWSFGISDFIEVPGGGVVSFSDFKSGDLWFQSSWRHNSALDTMAVHLTERSIIILSAGLIWLK